ncbi:unnamed protein product [Danaus chrysippus]|uniref:(African queen) hypothetical protein n=1 Tax=Danaus chrysippus TaxID=151541 RepID=A0A8J2W1A9_9NEOP|nr:unnamed protein product [Danaus chrysippus]
MILQNSHRGHPEHNLTITLKKLLQENKRLRKELFDATNKQHQEMFRAIQLKEKHFILLEKLREAQIESLIKRQEASRNAAKLAEANYYLEENLKETRNEVKMLIRKNKFLLSQCEKSSQEKD